MGSPIYLMIHHRANGRSGLTSGSFSPSQFSISTGFNCVPHDTSCMASYAHTSLATPWVGPVLWGFPILLEGCALICMRKNLELMLLHMTLTITHTLEPHRTAIVVQLLECQLGPGSLVFKFSIGHETQLVRLS